METSAAAAPIRISSPRYRQFVASRLNRSIYRSNRLSGKSGARVMDAFRYSRADSVAQAVQAGSKSSTWQQGATVRFVAGGTTLVDLMKLGVERPQELVDINGLGLDKIEA